jgi:hypothetical protein
MDWLAFQDCLDDRFPGNPAVNDKEAVDKCTEELTSAIHEIPAASAPKRRPLVTRGVLYPLVYRIKYICRISLRGSVKSQETPPPAALKAQGNRLHRSVTYRLNESRNSRWSETLLSLDKESQSLWKMAG